MNKLIYIADDDENIRSLIEMFLKNENYEVKAFTNGDSLYLSFLDKCPNLVILDIMMPGSDGLTICNKIRETSTVPIIMLTAKDSDVDQIAGLTLGSDDYITKPFNPTLLNVRVKALLRRVDISNKESEKTQEIISFCDLTLNNESHMIFCKDKELELTQNEFNCLAYLISNKEKAISRENFLKEIWKYDYEIETRVVDETIMRIRKKLKKYKSSTVIINKWGYGYMLRKEDNNEA